VRIEERRSDKGGPEHPLTSSFGADEGALLLRRASTPGPSWLVGGCFGSQGRVRRIARQDQALSKARRRHRVKTRPVDNLVAAGWSSWGGVGHCVERRIIVSSWR
jgi:hypothetical protein